MRTQILKSLYGSTLAGEIESNLIKELRKVKENIGFYEVHSKYIPFFWLDSSIYTTRDRYTNVRNLIKETRFSKAKKDFILQKVFVLDSKLYDVLADESKKREDSKEEQEFNIDAYFKTIEKLKSMIENKDFKVLNGQTEKSVLANLSMFYLAFVTGRRFYEIIKTLNIIKKGGKIYFDGLAKKRDEKDDIKLGLILDDDYKFVKKALKYVRNYYADLVKDMDSKQINAKYSKNITRALKRAIGYDISFHDIREQYAEIADKKFNKGLIDSDLFKAFVLGHEVNVDATQFYKSQKGI